MSKKTIALDFDGVIYAYRDGWRGTTGLHEQAVPGAIDFIFKNIKLYNLVIFSTRLQNWGAKRAARKWLIMQLRNWLWTTGANVNYSNQTAKWTVNQIKFIKNKPKAHLFIDDRAFAFTGTFPTKKEIDSFKPWNKK